MKCFLFINLLVLASCSHTSKTNLEMSSELSRLPSSQNSTSPSCIKEFCIGDTVFYIGNLYSPKYNLTGVSGKIKRILEERSPDNPEHYDVLEVVLPNEKIVQMPASSAHKSNNTQGCWTDKKNEEFCVDQTIIYEPYVYGKATNPIKAKIKALPSDKNKLLVVQKIEEGFVGAMDVTYPGDAFDMTDGKCKGSDNSFCVGSQYDNGLNSKDLILGVRNTKESYEFVVKLGDQSGKESIVDYDSLVERVIGRYSKPGKTLNLVVLDVKAYKNLTVNDNMKEVKEKLLEDANYSCAKFFNGMGVADLIKSPMPETMKCKFEVTGGPYREDRLVWSFTNYDKILACDDFKWKVMCTHRLLGK